MAGIIAMKNGKDGKTTPSNESCLELRDWLKILSDTYQRNSSLTERQVAAYAFTLQHLSNADITAACEEVLRSWKFVAMPLPAVILEAHKKLRIDRKTAPIDAELAWQQVLKHVREHFGNLHPPSLPAALEFAARAAGGLRFIESCSEQHLIFAKQRFLGALDRFHEGEEHLSELPEGPVKNLISGLADQKQLTGDQAWEAARAKSQAYSQRQREFTEYVSTIIASNPALSRKVKLAPCPVTQSRLDLLEEQARKIRANAKPEEIREAEQLRAL